MLPKAHEHSDNHLPKITLQPRMQQALMEQSKHAPNERLDPGSVHVPSTIHYSMKELTDVKSDKMLLGIPGHATTASSHEAAVPLDDRPTLDNVELARNFGTEPGMSEGLSNNAEPEPSRHHSRINSYGSNESIPNRGNQLIVPNPPFSSSNSNEADEPSREQHAVFETPVQPISPSGATFLLRKATQRVINREGKEGQADLLKRRYIKIKNQAAAPTMSYAEANAEMRWVKSQQRTSTKHESRRCNQARRRCFIQEKARAVSTVRPGQRLQPK
jgi:hypothetical protein